MKTKSKITIALTAATLAGLLQAEPPRPSPAEDQAKQKVQSEIFAKVSPREISFSRAAPMPREILQFEAQTLVDNEARLPFAILPRFSGALKSQPVLQGYVRLSDQAIYLLDSAAGRHVPAAQHPRFAPQQRQQHIEQHLVPVIPMRVDPA